PHEYPYVPHEGIFDTRITPLDGVYYVMYNVASRLGTRIMLARTTDFSSLETIGFIAGPDHRNCALFPEKIGGYYVRLERPHGESEGDIYISYSPDLIYWGRTKLLLEKNTRYWESAKVGPGAPPLRTDEGWLVIYHGVRKGMNGYTYQMGCMLLDLDDPSRIIGKMNEPLMSPEQYYERVGIVPNVVFPTAAIRHGGPDEIKVYYGAADTCIGLATGSISEILALCLNNRM
ncbi:MAG: glycoside hydrolase family 130 protein, partial [Armatimonadota bacterium]